MNGGTSLRPDGEMRQRFADSSMELASMSKAKFACKALAPLLPHSAVSVPAGVTMDRHRPAGYQLVGFGATVAVKGLNPRVIDAQLARM